MAMTEKEFAALPSDERENVLNKARLARDFATLPSADRETILKLKKAEKELPMSQFEAGARGTGQGLTMGWMDEAVANMTAAGKKFAGMMGMAMNPNFTDNSPSFSEIKDSELERTRTRDQLAEQKWPGTFKTTEIGGSVLTAFVPVGRMLGAAATTGKTLQFADEAAQGVKYVAPKIVEAAQGISRPIGKGLMSGATGMAKGAVLGGSTALGKADKLPENRQQFIDEILPAAGVQAVANIVGPLARGTSKAAVKAPGMYARSLLPMGPAGKSMYDAVAETTKNLAKDTAKDLKLEPLMNALKSGSKIAGNAGNVLIEAFEKQGGAGMVAAHVMMLEDPKYKKYLESLDKKKEK